MAIETLVGDAGHVLTDTAYKANLYHGTPRWRQKYSMRKCCEKVMEVQWVY